MTLHQAYPRQVRPGWTRKMPHAPDCPSEELHTLQPAGYVSSHEWAEKKMRTHVQIRCDGCGLYAIWIEKATTSESA